MSDELRYRMIAVKYYPATNHRGSRIKLSDLRRGDSIFIPYDDEKGRTQEQAEEYLKEIGITVDAIGLAYNDSDTILLTLNFNIPIIGQ